MNLIETLQGQRWHDRKRIVKLLRPSHREERPAFEGRLSVVEDWP
jgi:hypothetical protein